MKRIVMMALLALALPVAAFAGSINVDLTNVGGTLAGSSAGLTLTGSQLTEVNGFNGGGLIQGSLGSLTFTTGSLVSGNLTTGAVFSGAGSSFVITSNGTGGLPNGVLFTGSFSGNVTWTENLNCGPGGSVCYTLSGSITGTYFNGTAVNGATVQLTFNAGANGFTGSVPLASGDTVIATSVPEPGTLGLLGTGLVGLAGVIRKKLKA